MMKDKTSPILGLGNDIIEIERIRQSLEEHHDKFLNKLFSPLEQTYCLKHADPAPHLAGRFAAKEAIAKAFGLGFGKEIGFLDIEIVNDSLGKPVVHFSENLKSKMQGSDVMISISHCRSFAIATAVWAKC